MKKITSPIKKYITPKPTAQQQIYWAKLFLKSLKVKIPTHFRFKDEEEAKNWDTDTKTWHIIETMRLYNNAVEIASNRFAWVYYSVEKDNLEFKVGQLFTCKECETMLVDKEGEKCYECSHRE